MHWRIPLILKAKIVQKDLDRKDSLDNIYYNYSGDNHMKLKLEEGDAEKNNEDEEELDVDLKL